MKYIDLSASNTAHADFVGVAMMGVKQRMSIRLFIIFFIIGLAALTGESRLELGSGFKRDANSTHFRYHVHSSLLFIS